MKKMEYTIAIENHPRTDGGISVTAQICLLTGLVVAAGSGMDETEAILNAAKQMAGEQ
jgi:hypothetical protein